MYCPVSFENVVANAVSVHQENVTVRLAQHFHTNTTNVEAIVFFQNTSLLQKTTWTLTWIYNP